jgi:hypothetical protein
MRQLGKHKAFIRQYGVKRCLYLFGCVVRRKLGLLKKRFPLWSWEDRTVEDWLPSKVRSEKKNFILLHNEQGGGFLFPLGQLPETDPSVVCNAISQAENLLSGRMDFFSHESAMVGYPEVQWRTNPFSGQCINTRNHWCDCDVFNPEYGDIKFYWEPSRFSWAFALVRAYAATGEQKYPEAFWRLLENWMNENPVNSFPNFASGQEVALRSLACLLALWAFWKDPSSTEHRIRTLVTVLAASAERVSKHINFARAQMSNHAVTEAACLYSIGLLFPYLSNAPSWRKLGKWVLQDESRRHNWEDGSYTQHSTNYQRVMLHTYLWCMRLAERNGDSFSSFVKERIDKSWRFLYQLQDETTGRVPNYGPNDGANILPLCECDYLDYRPVLNSACYLMTRNRLYETGPWDEELRWLFGLEAPKAPVESLARRSCDFDIGGYYTLRGNDSWAMIRCHSYQSRPNQADMLHLDLWHKGVNVLHDSGTYSYYDPKEGWHRYFLSTPAHNTVTLGGKDQMVKGSRFRWHSLVKSRRSVHQYHDDMEIWQGEHYGYRRLPSHATHRRTVCRLGDSFWIVIDDILGQGKEKIELYWHLADYPIEKRENGIVMQLPDGPMRMEFFSSGVDMDVHVGKGEGMSLPLGWQSLYYGGKEPSPSICVGRDEAIPVRWITALSFHGASDRVVCDPLKRVTWFAGRDNIAEAALVPLHPEEENVVSALSFREHNLELNHPVLDNSAKRTH